MATKRKRASGTWEFTVKRKSLLPRPISLTFDTEEEGDRYCEKLESLLDQGIVPDGLTDSPEVMVTIADAIDLYSNSVHLPNSDVRVLSVIRERQGGVRLDKINLPWVDAWVTSLKREKHLSPSTIRHHVGALRRCIDWVGKRYPPLSVNPIRLLPRRYANYAPGDGDPKMDVERDRRLHDGEEDEIRRIIAGGKPEGRQRPLVLHHREALEFLFDLALESAMRMREMFTIELDQVVVSKKTIFLDKTKNGDKRQVPMTSVALAKFHKYVTSETCSNGMLFPWWDGDLSPEALSKITDRLSSQFGRIFGAAGCPDLRFHDLRHEATSRIFERTTLDPISISRITGHRDPRQLKRYANLRGSDLASKLW